MLSSLPVLRLLWPARRGVDCLLLFLFVCFRGLRSLGVEALVGWLQQKPRLQLGLPSFHRLLRRPQRFCLGWRKSVRIASAALWFCLCRSQARASCSTSTAAFSSNSGFGVEGTSCSRFSSTPVRVWVCLDAFLGSSISVQKHTKSRRLRMMSC